MLQKVAKLDTGEELIMEIKIIADNKHNISKKSFNNNLSALIITYQYCP
jgi:hypothetical protein